MSEALLNLSFSRVAFATVSPVGHAQTFIWQSVVLIPYVNSCHPQAVQLTGATAASAAALLHFAGLLHFESLEGWHAGLGGRWQWWCELR